MSCHCRKDGKFYWCPKHDIYGIIQLNFSSTPIDSNNTKISDAHGE